MFGAISANGRAKTAAAMGLPGRKYWMAFFGTLAAWVVVAILFIVMLVSALGAAGSAVAASATTAGSLETSIVASGDFKTSSGATAKAVDATCTPDTVDENGVGKYRCMIDFADKSRASYVVTVGADGKWVTD